MPKQEVSCGVAEAGLEMDIQGPRKNLAMAYIQSPEPE